MTLIERLKMASGPDRELDQDIEIAFVPSSARHLSALNEEPVPNYTSSIDAALSLAKDKDTVLREALRWISKKFDLHIRFWPEDLNYQHCLAIAICIEALEEREK